jgi:hypothetical protein
LNNINSPTRDISDSKATIKSKLKMLYSDSRRTQAVSQRGRNIHSMSANEFLNSTINGTAFKSFEDQVSKPMVSRYNPSAEFASQKITHNRRSKRHKNGYSGFKNSKNLQAFQPKKSIPNILFPIRAV